MEVHANIEPHVLCLNSLPIPLVSALIVGMIPESSVNVTSSFVRNILIFSYFFAEQKCLCGKTSGDPFQ